MNFEVEYPYFLNIYIYTGERYGLKEQLIKYLEHAFSILLRNVRIKV